MANKLYSVFVPASVMHRRIIKNQFAFFGTSMQTGGRKRKKSLSSFTAPATLSGRSFFFRRHKKNKLMRPKKSAKSL